MTGPRDSQGRLGYLLLVALLGLGACAAQPATGEGATPARASSEPAGGDGTTATENELSVELDRGDGSAVARYTLVCADVAGGDHPAAQEACDHLLTIDDPFAPIPEDAMCTQVFDGPQTARVTGRWRGEPVDLELGRNDGCRIEQWDRLGPLLPS